MNELIPTGNYNEKAITKYFNQQVKGAKKWGANQLEAEKQAMVLVNIYKHNFLIRMSVPC